MTAPDDAGAIAPDLGGIHVLLGVTGGVAAYKAASLARGLRKAGASVQAMLTESAAKFVAPAQFEALTGRPCPTATFTDVHRITHVAIAREADVAIIAPATANALAKFAHGLADDLVSSTFTCLTCPVIIAPAMHTEMWLHPATQANVAVLAGRGAIIVGPGEGELAGGDVGPGRLEDEDVLLRAVADAVRSLRPPPASPPRGHSASYTAEIDHPEGQQPSDAPGAVLHGRRVVVTAGGTRERIDPVRFLGNRSTGKMGYAIATVAAMRGAQVDLVAANTSLHDPPGVTVHRVESALEMRDAVMGLADGADLIVKAAAVADFRPADQAAQKIKKTDGAPTISLVANPDILAELGHRDDLSALLVGFAAETNDAETYGRGKLERKNADLIVVNDVSASDAGFETDTNRAIILGRDGFRREVPLTGKADLAAIILDEAAARL